MHLALSQHSIVFNFGLAQWWGVAGNDNHLGLGRSQTLNSGLVTKVGLSGLHDKRQLGVDATHEEMITSPHGKVRADVLVVRDNTAPQNAIVEMKVFSPTNTIPSSICDAVKVTMRRHAQFAGFLARQ